MAWIVILSEEEKKLFSFDERCLYIDGQPSEKKLKGLPFYVFRYLVESSPNFKTCDQIFDHVWIEELGKDKPIDDASIRDKISIIRNYLGDTSEPYLYIETADKAYRSTKKGASFDEPRLAFASVNVSEKKTVGTHEDSSSNSHQNGVSMLEEDKAVLRKVVYSVSRETSKSVDELIDEFEKIISIWHKSSMDVWKTFTAKQKEEQIQKDYFEWNDEKEIVHTLTTKS